MSPRAAPRLALRWQRAQPATPASTAYAATPGEKASACATGVRVGVAPAMAPLWAKRLGLKARTVFNQCGTASIQHYEGFAWTGSDRFGQVWAVSELGQVRTSSRRTWSEPVGTCPELGSRAKLELTFVTRDGCGRERPSHLTFCGEIVIDARDS